MMKIFPALFLLVLCSCKTTTYYISRHAERAGTMDSDPQLSAEGEKQAQDLRDFLKGKNIKAVYSTKFNRTRATAQPVIEHFGLPLKLYSPAQTNQMLDSLKANNKDNILIVGHSNTVDDIVNRLMGSNTLNDLPETEYGSLFIVTKKGGTYQFQKIKVPPTTPR